MDMIAKLLNRYNVKVVYAEFNRKGFFDPVENTIGISTRLTETQQNNALLHEIGHVAEHYNCSELYKASFVAREKMEHEANVFRINHLVSKYVADYGIDHEINIYRFIDGNEISSSDEKDVRSAFDRERKAWEASQN